MSRTITPVLWSRKTKDGNRQIYIRLTENRKSTYFTLNKSIPQRFWNKEYKRVSSKYPDYQEINTLIDDKIREIERNDIEVIKGSKGSYLNFFSYYLKRLEKSNRIGTYKKFNIVYNHLKSFLDEYNKKDLLFKDITLDKLELVKDYFTDKGISQTTQRSYFKIVKNIYNKGLERDLFITYKNPFNSFKLPKDKPGHKSLNIEEFIKIIKVKERFETDVDFLDRYKVVFDTLNYFLFSFYSHGMRFGDLIRLKWENISGVPKSLEIEYTMNKTNKEMKVPLYDELVDILRYYLPVKFQLIYLNMTNKDRSLYNFLDEKYRQQLQFFSGKEIRLTEDDTYTMRKDFNIKFYTNSPMKNLIDKKPDGIDRDFLRKLIMILIKRSGGDYIFPLYQSKDDDISYKKEYNYINTRLSVYNRNLKLLQTLCNLNTKLSSHISRHTFSDLSRQLGSSLYDISVSLNHQDLNTTQHYLNSGDIKSVEKTNKSFYGKLDTKTKQKLRKNKKG